MKVWGTAVAALAAASLAHAQGYKCTDARGKISYSDKPCATGQQSQGMAIPSAAPYTSGNPDAAVGMWETLLLARPRVSHPKQNPQPSAAELRAMGEMGYMYGRPMKTLKCGPSPIKEYVSRDSIAVNCYRQIEAHGGTCAFEKNGPSGGSGILGNKEAFTLTGNYRDTLNVKIRFIRVYTSYPNDPVVDESNISFRFLGECKNNMKPGDEFRVEEDGRQLPAR
jgi:hypothetical protein